MSGIRGIVCDFGGVLTTPLLNAFAAFQDTSGISLEALGGALARIAEEDGAHPLFELECGRLTEVAFVERLEGALVQDLGRPVELRAFGERYFEALDPNSEVIELMADLKRRDYRMALLTNNVREWEPLWRPMLPVDDIFEVVVDSGFVGMRKPAPEIYKLTLERIGLPADECIFLDDTEINCEAATALGMTAVHFRSTEQAIAEMNALLTGEDPSN